MNRFISAALLPHILSMIRLLQRVFLFVWLYKQSFLGLHTSLNNTNNREVQTPQSRENTDLSGDPERGTSHNITAADIQILRMSLT